MFLLRCIAFIYLHHVNCCCLHSLWDVSKAIWSRTKGVWCYSNKYCSMFIYCAIRNEQPLQDYPKTITVLILQMTQSKSLETAKLWWIAICPDVCGCTSVSRWGWRASLALGWQAELATSAQHLLRAQLEAISRVWKAIAGFPGSALKLMMPGKVFMCVCVCFR